MRQCSIAIPCTRGETSRAQDHDAEAVGRTPRQLSRRMTWAVERETDRGEVGEPEKEDDKQAGRGKRGGHLARGSHDTSSCPGAPQRHLARGNTVRSR